MIRVCAVVLSLVIASLAGEQPAKKHPDYVPDKKTALRIAEAVLIARYGEAQVKAGLPLSAGSEKGVWAIQLVHGPGADFGGGPVVFINRHSGCLTMFEHQL
jgi:hypothetical protein